MLVTSNFSFSYSVFKRLVLQTGKNHGLFGKGLKKMFLTFHESTSCFNDLIEQNFFENTVRKGEYSGSQHFLLFSLHLKRNVLPFYDSSPFKSMESIVEMPICYCTVDPGTVKPVLRSTCIEQSTALRDHRSDIPS